MVRRTPYIFLTDLDHGDPNFPAKSTEWASQMRSEMKETVALTRATITETKALMAEVDRIAARR